MKELNKTLKEKRLESSTHQNYYAILPCDEDNEEDIEEELEGEDDMSE